jgi:hypothetical protein
MRCPWKRWPLTLSGTHDGGFLTRNESVLSHLDVNVRSSTFGSSAAQIRTGVAWRDDVQPARVDRPPDNRQSIEHKVRGSRQ